MNDKVIQFQELIFKSSAYEMALAVIGVDKLTVAPKAGAEYRDKRTAYLAGELFSLSTDEKTVQLLEDIVNDESIDSDTRKAASFYLKDIKKIICIPKDEFIEERELHTKAYDAWLEAKTNDDYSIFEPYLKQVIETKKKFYGYRDSNDTIYNQMLDDYEPGMNCEKYDVFFNAIKEQLVPFIQKVHQAKPIERDFLYQNYDIEKQKKFTDHLLQYLHFDKEWGYQNETEHPFTQWLCRNDVRTTTKYHSDDVSQAILSTIHEVGHATYQHDIKPEYDGMIFGSRISSGMHESQSRLMENYLGKTLPFWKYNYPYLQELFSDELKGISVEEFVNAINASESSLVRIEADELTYPLHILVRYEIEKGLFDGSIGVENLDKTWDDLYEKYLGIRAPKASKGILQDVHWSDGSFGYFPTYALGSAMAAQFMTKMRQDIDVDGLLENNQYDKIVDWLKENIHQYGCYLNATEVLTKVTGEEFNAQYYIDYLIDKYTKLYQLD